MCGLVISLLAHPITSHAEDTEDLLNMYDLTLGKPDATEIETEINKIEQDMLGMQTQQEINEEYNALLELYIEKKTTVMNEVMEDVSVYQSNNEVISKYISSNILEADINDLLLNDASYKSNNVDINILLSRLNTFSLDESFKNVDFDTSILEAKLADAKVVYADAIDTFELGDVTNIKWVLPNDRYVTSTFGYRVDPLNSKSIRYHSGTDYRAPEGTPISALFNGVVTSCGWSDSAGYFITIESGENIRYFVCHLSEIQVEKGQTVKQYDVIGLSGGTGSRSTGPHLHLALYINGSTYDVDTLFK